jgi:hypothetical protein
MRYLMVENGGSGFGVIHGAETSRLGQYCSERDACLAKEEL